MTTPNHEEERSTLTPGPVSGEPSPTAFNDSTAPLSPSDWWRLEQEMSFSRDSSHLTYWPNKIQSSGKKETCENLPEQRIWYCVQFRRLCEICLAMPLVGLVACLAIALVFQFEHIQETACKVQNFVPSISAVTGISPGRYLWRMAIAFHMGPRLLIVASYYHYLLSFAARLPKEDAGNLAKLLHWCFYLQLVEIVGLCGISFVHNREHYPTHEKGFILYLTSSHMSFLLVLKIYHLLWPLLDSTQKLSYRKKLLTFSFSFVCLILMGYFYYRHIIHCDSLAFSVFAFVEYWVAAANMAFYWTVGSDMPNEEIVVIRPAFQSSPKSIGNKINNNSTPGTSSNGVGTAGSNPRDTPFDLLDKCTSTLHMVKNVLAVVTQFVVRILYNQASSGGGGGTPVPAKDGQNDFNEKKEN